MTPDIPSDEMTKLSEGTRTAAKEPRYSEVGVTGELDEDSGESVVEVVVDGVWSMLGETV